MSKVQIVWFRDLVRWDTEYFTGNHRLESKFKLVDLSEILIPRKERIKPNEYDGITPIVAKIPFSNPNIELRKEPKTKMDMYAVYRNDLLVSNINFHQGAVAICRENKVFASTHYQPYIVNTDNIDLEFLVLVLRQNSYQQYIGAKKIRGIKTESNFNFIKTLQIPLPPLEIQQQIVAKIQSIKAQIKALQTEEKRLKDEIESFIYIALGLEIKEQKQKQKVFVVNFKDLERWDITYNQGIGAMIQNITKYNRVKLKDICFINPDVDFKELIKQNRQVSFVPMEAVSSNGVDFYPKVRKSSDYKGFTKFQDNDLLWAKITPCMQNKKSVVVKNLKNGFGFGSTEFFVLRPRNKDEVDINFILYFLRMDYIIENAKLHFKGSAGQQRVPKEFLENLQIPLPPLEIQQKIINFVESKRDRIKANQKTIQSLQDSMSSELEYLLIV